jgi:hypothetical protein
MPRFMCVMKLDPADNRVTKYCEHPTKAEADAHVAAHIGNYPDAFVHEDGDAEPTVDISAWRFDPVSKEILDRIKRPKPLWYMARLRTERNTKLTESDWTQYNDSPLTDEVKAEWAVHRETLRDLPANTDDPADPTWPTPPG